MTVVTGVWVAAGVTGVWVPMARVPEMRVPLAPLIVLQTVLSFGRLEPRWGALPLRLPLPRRGPPQMMEGLQSLRLRLPLPLPLPRRGSLQMWGVLPRPWTGPPQMMEGLQSLPALQLTMLVLVLVLLQMEQMVLLRVRRVAAGQWQ